MSIGRLLNRQVLLDVLVNAIPLGILLSFVLMFVVYRPYPGDSLVVVVQLSLVLVPALLLVVLTYYAVAAVTRAERTAGSGPPPGYSQADAETLPADDD